MELKKAAIIKPVETGKTFTIASTGSYRIDQLEKGLDDLEEDVDAIGNIAIGVGRDFVWLRWG